MKIVKNGKEINLNDEECESVWICLEQKRSDVKTVKAELENLSLKSEDEQTARLAGKWLCEPEWISQIADKIRQRAPDAEAIIRDEMYHFFILEEAAIKKQKVLVPRKFKMKVCPFCGGNPLFDENDDKDPYVRCLCGVRTNATQTPEEAVAIWNHRFYETDEVEVNAGVYEVPDLAEI